MKRRWKLSRAPFRALLYVLTGVLLLAGGTSFILAPLLRGPAGTLPDILIQAPREWASGEAAGRGGAADVVVTAGGSVAISGMARHTSPIAEVHLGGKRLAATFGPDRLMVEFSGFFDERDLRADGTVDLEVRTVSGVRAVRSLPVRIDSARAPGASIEDVYSRDRHQRWAVVIGIDSHDDSRIPPLDRAGADAAAIADLLRSPAAGLGGLPGDRIRALTGEDATGRNVRSALKTFLRGAAPGDLVLIYIAGRTLPDPDHPGRWYLALRDTDRDDIPATALDVRVIREAVEEVFGHTRVVLGDLVQEQGEPGAAASPLLAHTIARQGGLAILTVSGTAAAHQHSPGPHGALASSLLHGLGGGADPDGDGTIRTEELLAHIRARVPLESGGQLVPELSATAYDRSWPVVAARSRSPLADGR